MSKGTTLATELENDEGRTRAIWDDSRALLIVKTADGRISELSSLEARQLEWAINHPEAFQIISALAARADVAQAVQSLITMRRRLLGD